MRLLRTLRVKGGFGVFDDSDDPINKGLLRRCLLWRRESGKPSLRKIDFGEDREMVPSWSWMAVSGGIDYFHPRFDRFDWPEVESPWSLPTQVGRDNSIKAHVLDFQLDEATSQEHEVIFDDSERSKQDKTKVIILGIERTRKDKAEKRHYVLLVDMKGTFTDGYECCERVGAGYLPGKMLTGTAKSCALI
jgi:hypothetical protein